MNTPSKNEVIDKLLQKFADKSGSTHPVPEYCEQVGFPINDYTVIFDAMVQEGIAQTVTTGPTYLKISPKGLTIVENGGWLTELERRRIAAEKESHRQQIELDEKTKNVKLLGWQLKVFWYLFIFSIVGFIGGIFGIISFFRD